MDKWLYSQDGKYAFEVMCCRYCTVINDTFESTHSPWLYYVLPVVTVFFLCGFLRHV